jgi:hypothetical protein
VTRRASINKGFGVFETKYGTGPKNCEAQLLEKQGLMWYEKKKIIAILSADFIAMF